MERISLISRSDIRYVGVLHQVNQAESTVSLQQGQFDFLRLLRFWRACSSDFGRSLACCDTVSRSLSATRHPSSTAARASPTVRSFGTEGRKGTPEEEIPASDQVFDFIVFRGADIKDLQVLEAASQQQAPKPAPSMPNDPAILGVR